MSNFAFLKAEWPELHDAAPKAEGLVYPDARAACFYTRRVLELAVAWLYQHDRTLTLPYQDHLSALIHEPSFRQAVGPAVFTKAKLLEDLGNQGVHSTKPIRQYDALTAVRELFHFCFWLTRTTTTSLRCCKRYVSGRLPEARRERTSAGKPGPRLGLASTPAPACRTAYC